MLPRLMGTSRAVGLSLIAKKMPADMTLEWGPVDRLHRDSDALMSGAMVFARQLAKEPRALALMRRVCWEPASSSFEQQIDFVARLQGQAGRERSLR